MKFKLFAIIFFIILLVECTTKKAVMYEFPPTMGDEIKVEYVKIFDKGKILYDLNCAKCHNQEIKGKMVIPDFTDEQLVNYEIRILNQEHLSNIPEMEVAEDELATILTFLRYKKKSNVPAKKAPNLKDE